jgi:restriction system protein
MKNYFRLMLGPKSIHAQECFDGNFVGVNFGINEDLTGKFPEEWRQFNKAYIPVYLAGHPDKSKVAAGLACGALWTVGHHFKTGDIVICPDGNSRYRIGEIGGGYVYAPTSFLPHQRPVRWLSSIIDRADMSEALKNSTGSIGTISKITQYQEELEKLIGGVATPMLMVADTSIEDAAAFAMESHLEEFLIRNWKQTELGKEYDIYEVDGEQVGQQFATDTGPLDILAISKDKRTLLVVELKRGRASDVVVGQVLRYMGFVQEELAEEAQQVKGVIIAQEDDTRLKRALAMTPSIDFLKYEIRFKLVK